MLRQAVWDTSTMMEGQGGRPQRPSWPEWVAGIPMGLFLRKSYRGQPGGRYPFGDPVVMLNDRSEALVRLAEKLAESGGSDGPAVEELRNLARRNRHDLLVAASWFELGGRDRESRRANRGRRLLQAAAGDGDVAAMSAEEEQSISVVEEWMACDPPRRFQALVEVEPRLGPLEASARSDDFRTPEDLFKMEADDPRRVLVALHDLIGPHGLHKDHPLLGRSAVASDATRYLYVLIDERGDEGTSRLMQGDR
jgi:hypothetical protein